MTDTRDEAEQFEEKAALSEPSESEQVRRTIADVYTFVRSAEINRTIASFTLDHYLDEAKRKIKEDRLLRSAANPEGIGSRPSQLSALEKLEADFDKVFAKAKEMAEKVGAVPEEKP